MIADEHRLAAILFADIVGYSLIPEGLALQFRRRMLAMVQQSLSTYRGRLVKNQGDDVLVEFSSATDAVRFAIELQDKISTENATLGLGQRFRLRIGIHAGEVVVDGGDILGDAVNTAKRTESLAAPGGVCLTESVWRQVLEQLPRPARRLGRISAKHLKLPLVFCHIDPPGVGWAYRFAHRFRLGLGHPGYVAGLLVLAGCVGWAVVLLALLAARLLPRDPSRLIENAQSYLDRYDKEGYIQRAIDELARVPPGATSQYAEARACLGLAYWRRYLETGELKTRTDALNASSLAVALNGENPVAHLVQGLVAENRGDLIAASNELCRADGLRKNEDGLVLIELAKVCLLLNDGPAAADYIQKAKEVRTKPWAFYNELAKYESGRGNYEAAVTNCLEALRCAPRNSLVECNLASLYLCLSDFTNHQQEASACLEKARKYRTTAFYYHVLGQYCVLAREPDRALASFRKATELKPEDYRFCGDAGLVLKTQGRLVDAAHFLKRAIDKAQPILNEDKQPGPVLALVGLYQAALGDATNALKTLQQAVRKCPGDSQVQACAESAAEQLPPGKEAEALHALAGKP